MKIVTRFLTLCVFLFLISSLYANDVAQHLQDVSATIKAAGSFGGSSTGSGVFITREVPVGEAKETINFLWTAGHVVDSLRSTREIIGPDGQKKTVVEFKDAKIVKELSEGGRKVGQIEMDARVIKYSDADNGEDLALLMVRKRNFVTASAKFYLEGDMILPVGTNLFHVGSLLGQPGANSMTSGILSQVGRVLQLGNGGGVIFDQNSCPAFPGCLVADTAITLADNTLKRIVDIKEGDKVLSYDNSIGKTMTDTVVKCIESGHKEIYRISTKNRTIEASGNHPFVKINLLPRLLKRYIPTWTQAEDLQENDLVGVIKDDKLLPNDLSIERITSIKTIGMKMTYDLTIDRTHNFIANGFLVHNSSGGGIFIAEGDHKGKYIGMLVRGAGETFTFMVPIRRMHKWATDQNVLWALDEQTEVPTLEHILGMPVEDPGTKKNRDSVQPDNSTDKTSFPFLLDLDHATKSRFNPIPIDY